MSRAGRDIDDMPAAAADHRRQYLVRAIDHAEEIRAHDLFDGVKRRFDEGPAHADAGVIDENVDLAKIGDRLFDHRAHLRAVADVAGEHPRHWAGGANIIQRFLKALLRAPATDDGGSSFSEVAGEAAADAPRRAGDQNDFSSKVHKTAS